MKNILKNIIFCLIVISIGIVVFYIFASSRPVATAKQEVTDLPIVNTEMLSSVNYLSNIKTYGEVVSERILNIKYRDKGKVIKIGENVKNGKYIEQGNLIFKIDSFYIENEIKEKSASQKILYLKLKKAKYQIESSELKNKEIVIQRDIIKNQLNRRSAVKSKVFSDNSIDDLRLSLSIKEQNLIDNIELIEVLKIEVETLKLDIERLQIIIDKLKNDLIETSVFAPYSGHLSDLNIEVGKEITNNDKLGILSDTENLEVKFFIGGSNYHKLKQFKNNGLHKKISIKWMIGNKFYEESGKITRIDGAVNKEIAGINVYAKIQKSSSKIPLGAFVEINLSSDLSSKVIMVPTSSIFNNKYIYLVKNSRLIQEEIVIISEEQDGVLIKDTNLSGNYMATTRLSSMQDNMQINVINK